MAFRRPRPNADPPPVWDGNEPHLRWKRIRRHLVLRAEDFTWPTTGNEFQNLPGRGEELRSEKRVEHILAHVANPYMRIVQIEKGVNLEKYIYDTPRRSDERYIPDCYRKAAVLRKYRADVGSPLPDIPKGKSSCGKQTSARGTARRWPCG